MDLRYKQMIASEFENCIINTLKRLEKGETHRPFHEALLSEEALLWSRFERSFSTSFGQRVIEKISEVAAIVGGATDVSTQKETIVTIDDAKASAIEMHISSIRQNTLGRKSNWDIDVASINSVPNSGVMVNIRVISDLWWRKDGIDNFMSIKTVKPNIDQTAEAKRDLLKLKVNDMSSNVYYGLYYNPYGENKADYAWTPPKGFFNFNNDPVVLIGRDYWDVLGGTGFYDEIISIANEVGIITRKKLAKFY